MGCAILALVVSAGSDRCRADVVPLGAAGNYAVLGLNVTPSGTHINASNVTINGAVGVSHSSTFVNMAPSTVTGTVFYQDAGSVTGPGHYNGTPQKFQQSMVQAVDDAFYANAQNALLVPNQTIAGNVTTSQTFTAVAGGLTVIGITGGINLNNNNITLTGSATDIFVVNVGGDFALTGTASLLLAGGVIPEHVLYNFTGGNSANHGSFNTHVGDVVYGTMLAPYYDMNLDGTWFGELIGGPMSIGLLSGATVTQHPFEPVLVPLPAGAAMGGAGFVGVAGLGLCVESGCRMPSATASSPAMAAWIKFRLSDARDLPTLSATTRMRSVLSQSFLPS